MLRRDLHPFIGIRCAAYQPPRKRRSYVFRGTDTQISDVLWRRALWIFSFSAAIYGLHRYRTDVAVIAHLHVIRFPRALLFVFCRTQTVLGGKADRIGIGTARTYAADI